MKGAFLVTAVLLIFGVRAQASVSVDEAIARIPDGSSLYVAPGVGTSYQGVRALLERCPHLEKGFKIYFFNWVTFGSELDALAERAKDKCAINGFYLDWSLRRLYKSGVSHFVPLGIGGIVKLMNEHDPDYKIDFVLMRISKPKKGGPYRLGPVGDLTGVILRDFPDAKVVGGLSEGLPQPGGNVKTIAQKRILAVFQDDSAPALEAPPSNKVDSQIAENLAKLIGNGSTIELGVASHFGSLADALKKARRRDLHISTEFFGQTFFEMVKEGEVSGPIETGSLFGSRELYSWLDGNKQVSVRDFGYMNNPARIAKVPHFIAINAAMQVDLRGNANSVYGPGAVPYGGAGGQLDYMMGGFMSPHGKAVIAMPSTAEHDSISKIVLENYAGTVTTPGLLVTDVVTEYGIAHLQGLSESKKAQALIRIAHPQFREDLAKQALKSGLLKREDAEEWAH